jgi:hypothetical protein
MYKFLHDFMCACGMCNSIRTQMKVISRNHLKPRLNWLKFCENIVYNELKHLFNISVIFQQCFLKLSQPEPQLKFIISVHTVIFNNIIVEGNNNVHVPHLP